MITEYAIIEIRPDTDQAFEAAVTAAVPLFQQSIGCHSMTLQRLIEQPQTYQLVVHWETLEHHTVTFRESEAFSKWRELVSPFFAKPPRVVHSRDVVQGF